MPYRPATLNTLGGLNEDENPSSLQQDQLRKAFNCARKGSLTGTRPGLVYDAEYTDAISGTPEIQGIEEFRSVRDANRSLVTVAGGAIHYNETDTLTKSGATVSSGAGNLWSFASYQDLLWAAGGASGDTVWTWDGDTSGTPTATGRLAPLGIKPQYVFAKFNTLFLGGFLDGTDAWNNPLVGRYCDYASDATDVLSWPNSNAIPGVLLGENPGVGSYGSEYNTGFGSYQDNQGDFLMFLTNQRIIAFRQNPSVTSNANRFVQTDAIANGCVSQHAYIDLGYDQGDAVYVSQHGVHSMALSQQFGNRENAFLSWPIRKTWDTVNRSMLPRTMGAYWPEEGMVLIAVATGSSTHLDTILCMDIKGAGQITPDTVRWYKWPISAANVNVLKAARDPDGVPRIYAGGQGGEVAPFSRSSYADLGSSFSVNFRTKDEDYGLPSVEKSIGNTLMVISGIDSYSPTHRYILDDGNKPGKISNLHITSGGFVLDNASGNLSGASQLDVGVLGSEENLSRDRVRGVGSGYTISHEFSHSGINEPFFIGQITQDVAAQGMADEAAA